MTAHPDIAKVSTMLREVGLIPPADRSVEEVRDYLERISRFVSRSSVPLEDEILLEFGVGGRPVPCKLYWPDRGERPNLLIYCHGGGFRHGTLPGWDAPLRRLVRDSDIAVLSIEYALAPEYVFPTAFNEVVAVASEVISSGTVAGLPVAKLALGGDSAGANLVLGAALDLKDRGVSELEYLLLFYGVYSKDTSSASWVRLSNFGGHGLSSQSMDSYWSTYLSADEGDWRVQPLHADLRGLPETRLVVGELDPLLDEHTKLDRNLKAAGVKVSLSVLPGIIHGVVRFCEVAHVVADLLRDEANRLRDALKD